MTDKMAKAEIFRDKAGEWRFRLVGPNGEVVASSEGYFNREDAVNTAYKVREYVLTTPVDNWIEVKED